MRLYYRYARARFENWHCDGLPLVFGGGEALFLGAGLVNYSTVLFEVYFQNVPGRPEQPRS